MRGPLPHGRLEHLCGHSFVCQAYSGKCDFRACMRYGHRVGSRGPVWNRSRFGFLRFLAGSVLVRFGSYAVRFLRFRFPGSRFGSPAFL